MMMLYLFLLFGFKGIMSITYSIQQTPYAFYLVKETLTWSDAQNYCRMRYTDLARVKDDSIWLKLTKLAANSHVTEPIWIGLYNDINSWRWCYNGQFLEGQTSLNWYPGQPDNYNGNEACGGLDAGGFWRDYSCSILKPLICYSAAAGRFVRVNIAMTWTEGQLYCRMHQTDLAYSFNQNNINELNVKISNQGPSWFGLSRETWKWMNGTIPTSLHWAPGQPDNLNLQENCGMMQDRLYNDENCDHAYFFYCEYLIPPVTRQFIKLQVKSDESVLDPAVQSSILELIKQKLKQHAILKDITVTWRVQPNRNIFQKKKNFSPC